MPARPRQNRHPYFFEVRRYILEDGERFATVVDIEKAPAYYPTCLMLARRSQAVTAETLATEAQDLVHLGQWALREGVSLNDRLERGEYLTQAEIQTLADACGVTTKSLRRSKADRVSGVGRKASASRANAVTNTRRNRRITTIAAYIDLVAIMSEAALPRRSPAYLDRVAARKEMLARLRDLRASVLSSRVRGVVPADDLARITIFVSTGDPAAIWSNPAVRLRNWAFVSLLIACGLRQGEARQIKLEDLDFARRVLLVERRHDDPDDPRLREPNAKTYDRPIPFEGRVATALEAYVHGPGSDAAELRGSPFLFLSHDNRTRGTPISDRTAAAVVRDLGRHLGVPHLTPHDLRHAWIQNLASWAIASGLPAHEFERFANHLGGWSQLSRMASEYRGDQLTEAAFLAGLAVERSRS